ncbi:MAG TPA: hypothetical protein VJ623_10000 [Holophagaceae bacterium]|nr:hypothetical protein [Holophagaceae bacterium]
MTRTALSALLLPFLGAALGAQTPAPASQAPAAQAPAANLTLGQRLDAERPEIDKLLEALQPKEALAKAEALLPATAPVFDTTDPASQYRSYFLFKDVASAYYLASRAATSGGQWEKGLEYVKKAQALVQENGVKASAAFVKISEAHQARVEALRKTMKDNESIIRELQAKPVKDAADQQMLGFVEKDREALAEAEKWAKQYLLYADTAKKEGARYDAAVKVMEDRLAFEANQIAEYKAGEGDKTKWVDAIVSNPSYLTTSFPEKRVRFEFLCRLAVIDPANPKVTTALDVELGKAPAPKAKPVHKAKPKAKKGE